MEADPHGVQQPVAPHQHFNFPLARQVGVVVIDGPGEQLRRVLAFAAGAVLRGDEEHLVHADVQGVGLEAGQRLAQLLRQVFPLQRVRLEALIA